MGLRERVANLVVAAIHAVGSGEALAARIGVTPQAVTNWKNGHSIPNAHHLIRLQDLVKRAACVLIALAGLAQAPDSGATGQRSAPTVDNGINFTVLHIVRRLAHQVQAWLRRALLAAIPA